MEESSTFSQLFLYFNMFLVFVTWLQYKSPPLGTVKLKMKAEILSCMMKPVWCLAPGLCCDNTIFIWVIPVD